MASWSQLGLDIDGEAQYDESGRSVSLSADGLTVAIGAPGNSGNKGHVRIYKYLNNVWTQLGSDIDGEAANDFSGISVSLSANGLTVAIGATGNSGNGEYSGHVRIYKYLDNVWTQLGLDIDSEAQYDQSGRSVSLSADGLTVAIGAPYNDGNKGHVRIYKYLNNVWTQLGLDIDGEAANDNSGFLVSLSADGLTVAISAPFNDGNSNNAGHVRIYKYLNNVWTQLGLDIDGEAANDQSGRSVSLSADGLTVAIGAPGNSGNKGHVRIYKYLNNVWTQLGSDIDGEAANDFSGRSVYLSADGLTVAISAPYNDGNKGHVRIYKYLNNVWTQLGLDIDGEAANDNSGISVSLSANGLTVAIGATGNSGNKGHVRIYKLNEPTPVVPICFVAGTPVETDQGSIAIEKINTKTNTIRGKKIIAITKTVTIEDKIVCIEKDTLGTNIPSQKTFISRNHKLFFNKQMIKAKHLIGQVDGVYNKKYNGEVLYNVLLETHSKMMVNNLIVETLDPANIIAQLYNSVLTVEERNNTIVNINQCANDYKKVYGKLR
jgi:hypothetical protein